MILSVDTTSEFGSLALLEGERLIDELLLHSPQGFAHVIFDHLQSLLQRHSVSIHNIDCFASASGPGSFTGVRVGLAAAKGLAEATGKPVIAVSNLQAIAEMGTAPLRAVVLDARRGEIYGAAYDARLTPVLPEVVTRFPLWLDSLPDSPLEFLSTDFAPFRSALEGTRFANAPVRDVPRTLAAAIGRIAARRYAEGVAADPVAIDANYVRRSDAELFWKDY